MEKFSKYFQNGTFFTAPKNKILGVVIHNDAGSISALGYESFLENRVNNGTLSKGFAAYYVDRNDIFVFQPSNHAEWHTANAYGNSNFIGLEVCQSMSTNDKEFIANEDATLLLAAEILKSYNLPINKDTVKLHHEFSATSCPHRSMELHSKGGAYNGEGTENCRNYFINRMKKLISGEEETQFYIVNATNLKKLESAYYEATVKEDYYIESSPDIKSEDKELLKAGTRVRVFEKLNGWSRVNYKDSEQWIEDEYLIDAEIL